MTEAKSTSRQAQRRDQRRQAILEVANRLFSAHGYENVTLRAVAEELGYTHAALYRHFPDKAHLLAEICQETFARLVVHFDAVAASYNDPVERLFETSRGFVRFSLEHPQHFRAVFFGPEDRNGTRVGLYISEIGRPFFERIVKVFKESAQINSLALPDPDLAARTWWSAVMGLTMVIIISGEVPGRPPPARQIEQLMATMWAGLGASLSRETTAKVRQQSTVAAKRHLPGKR